MSHHWYLTGTVEGLSEIQADAITERVGNAVKRRNSDGTFWIAYLSKAPVQPGQVPFKLNSEGEYTT